MVTSLERFKNACHCRNGDRPPVWLMRQAGRALPEYRALRERHDFSDLLTRTELITEISLQPWRRFQMDVVIVFSDILLLPWKMGMDLKFLEGQGPKFSAPITTEEALNHLQPLEASRDIPFLTEALRQLKKELGSQAALIGFSGSPWTVASYVAKNFEMLRRQNPELLKKILERFTRETIGYLNAQVEAGVDALQIFDSWGGVLSPEEYAVWSAPYIGEIIRNLAPKGIPILLYVKDSRPLLDLMIRTGCSGVSIGWETPLQEARSRTQETIAVQGNFNPHLLMQANPKQIREETEKMLETMQHYPGYIANLGHGVLPKTPLENIAAFVETIQR